MLLPRRVNLPMRISPVTTSTDKKEFLQLPLRIYAGDPNWIQPLDKDINAVFDPNKNKSFRHGRLQRWLLRDDTGLTIGRVAAFTNKKYKNKNDDVAAGGIGFFECINDEAAAAMLLDTAKEWLQNEGMAAMDGPINFGERDRWWGMVTKGFMEPMYCMNYNPPYYVALFENYGFRLFYEQVCFSMQPKAPLDEKIARRHDQLADDPKFSAAHIKKSALEKYARDFTAVYNSAWAGHGGLKELPYAQVLAMFKSMKPVMDEKIIWFAYYGGEPVAIFINLPDLNQWFKYLHGKFGPFQKLKFLLARHFKKNKKFTGIVFGVVPEWQGKGVDAYIIAESAKVIQSPAVSYTEYEMQWIGDFNPKMLNIAAGLGNVSRSRSLVTYRYLFARNKEFVRHPILN